MIMEIISFNTALDRESTAAEADTFLIVRGGAELMRVSTFERAELWIATNPTGEMEEAAR